MKFYIVLAIIHLGFYTHAQVHPLNVQVIPPSPNASSLGKFSDIPVSLYTGTPDISIPMFEVKGRDLTVPISLNYHAGGVRVEEISSNVGLGWALNAGGAILRIARGGLPDEDRFKGILNHGITPDEVLESNVTDQSNYFRKNSNGELDFEPDIFYFNFIGRSGKFLLTKEGENYVGYPIPYSDISIKLEGNTWTIVDEGGIRYTFGDDAKESTLSVSMGNSGRSGVNVANYTSSWYLKRIISTKGEEIDFAYRPYEIEYCMKTDETEYHLKASEPNSPCTKPEKSFRYNEISVSGVAISTISSDLFIATFEYESNDRSDMPGDKALKAVILKDKANRFQKKFELTHGYFSTPGGGGFSLCADPSKSKRLKLENVKEIGEDGSSLPPYVFAYNSMALPGKFSNAQDHWGFYNNANNNSLIPTYAYMRNTSLVKLPGANRNTYEGPAKAGTLEKITFPTKGYTTFEFESHDAVLPEDFFEYLELDIPKVGYAGVRREGSGRFFFEEFNVNLKTIVNDVTGGKFDVTVRTNGSCDPSKKDGCGAFVYITNIVTGSSYYSFEGGSVINGLRTTKDVFLPNGTYRLEIEIFNPSNTSGVASAGVTGPDPAFVRPINTKIGGLRVKSIKNFDAAGNQLTSKNYTYLSETSPTSSSGVVVSKPVYAYPFLRIVKQGAPVPGVVYSFTCVDLVRTASSNAPLSTTQGSHVGYASVQVYNSGLSNMGKEVHKFTTALDFPDITYYSFPFAPSTSRDWTRGLLLETTVYKSEGTDFVPVKKSINKYKVLQSSHDPYFKSINGLKMGCQGSGTSSCLVSKFQKYDVLSYWFHLDSLIEIDYESGKSLKRYQKYFHTRAGTHAQVTKIISGTSESNIRAEITKYPLDYVNTSSEAIAFLQEKHIINTPVEQQVWMDDKLLSGQINEYAIENQKPFVGHTFILENTKSIDDFVEEKQQGKFTKVIPDARYKLNMTVGKVDPETGNILEYTTTDGLKTSILYAHEKSLPVAEVKNAPFTQVFYESFEEESINFSTDAKTGFKSKNGPYLHTVSQLTPGKYWFSYWKKIDEKWKLIRDNVTVSGTEFLISLDGQVDDIRFYPEKAQMKNFVYKGKLLFSMTDANDKSVTYQYDGFNRLKSVKDDDGNILKNYTYGYANQ